MAYTQDIDAEKHAPSSDHLEAASLAIHPMIKVASLRLAGRRVRLRLEVIVWETLEAAARDEQISVHSLCERIDQEKCEGMPLTSALRVFALGYYRNETSADRRQ